MNRFVLLKSEPLVDESEVVLELSAQAVVAFLLEATLQLAGLSDSTRFSGAQGPSVVLTLSSVPIVGKARVDRSGDRIVFELGRNQLEHIQAFLLRAYRDGSAEVNHIHLEGTEAEASFDLTLMFDVFQEPMTAAEARQLLGV